MAIDRIPGVGPTNSDIATAVAAPSAASIAAAVAAPSSSTIATAVAAAVPTTAGITSIVQANAGSPFGGTWTFLSSQNPAASTISFTGLSGYKRYRLYLIAYKTGTSYNLNCTINGLTSYGYSTKALVNNQTTPAILQGATDANFQLNPGSITNGFTCNGYLTFDQASSGQYKTIDWVGGYLNANNNGGTYAEGHAWVKDTAAINRIDINSNTTLGALSSTGFWLFGGN